MKDAKKRVVISGVGVISPTGIGKEQFWQNLFDGKSGIKSITLFDASGLKVKVGGEITEFEPAQFFDTKILRTLDRATTLLAASTKIALQDAKLEINSNNCEQIGVSVGTTFGSLSSISEFDKTLIRDNPRYVNPSLFPNTVINSPASHLPILFHIKGFNTTVSSAMCASLDALDYAVDFIRLGRAKIVVCGAVEEFCQQTFLGFYKLKCLSGMKHGKALSCPFDQRREGIVFSEGSVVLIVEDLESANQRNAHIYAEILGSGSFFDSYRINKYNPSGKGMKKSMQYALDDADLSIKDIDCIFANANSTKDADAIETTAIKDVFGKQAYTIPVTAIKSLLGETFSASGALAVSGALGSMERSFIPPTINYQEKDCALDLDYVPNESRGGKINKVMINSFSFSGHNKSVIIGRYL